jgi:uroporphyrinogen decarboxylase
MANIKFHNALNRVEQKTPPVWMMRQAGRYHNHYQAMKKQNTFIELCKSPELAAKVALGPMEDFDFDVAILFSDLLFPLEALGMGLKYDPAPELSWSLDSIQDFKKMRSIEKASQELLFQGEALKETRRQLPTDKSLIGFVGSPWTLFVYAVAGTHKGSLVEVKKRMSLFPAFCEMIKPLMDLNIKNQLDNGAEIVMIFDTAAGELSASDFNFYIFDYLNNLSNQFSKRLGYYSKHTLPEHLSALWKSSAFAGFGYDHRWNLSTLFKESQGFVQGNFDQSLLFLPKNEFEKSFRNFLGDFKKPNGMTPSGWVCGLGHGVLPETPEENVRSFVKILREFY